MSSGKIVFVDFLLFLMMVFLRTSSAVRINKLQVPKVIRHGAPVVLDCDFTVDETDQELVVKWFFNKNKTLVYQWIPEADNKPQGLGILRDRLNLGYKASPDERKRHRALHILNPGPDLSGDYTCSVSTVQNEDMRTKTMLVYVPEKNLRIRRLNIGGETMQVECIADGVFPEPSMKLHSQKRDIPEPEVLVRRHGQLYEISATTTLPILEDPEEFSCELKISQANYTMRRETVFYPGNNANMVLSIPKLSLLILWMTAYCSHQILSHNTGVGVRINNLRVPDVTEYGAPVVLDCDFTVDDDDDELVVKWFFNKNKTLVYQWIPANNKPQGLGILRNRLNLDYEASGDAKSRHRALHILKPGPDLSGDYTCSVSTVQNEDIQTKNMLVYVPEKNLRLHHQRDTEGFIRIKCTADGVFPQPKMLLRSLERDIPQQDVFVARQGVLFEISATAKLPLLEDPEEFSCELRIPQANYTVRRETVVYPASAAANGMAFNRWLITLSLVLYDRSGDLC